MAQKFPPINTDKPWPRERWWVASNAVEVTRVPQERTILGEPVVLFRSEADDPIAIGETRRM